MTESIARIFEKETGETAIILHFDTPKRTAFATDFDADKLSVRRIQEIFKEAKSYGCDCWLQTGRRHKIVCGCE